MTLFNNAFLELLKFIIVLLVVVVGYIISGIANNCLNKNEAFNINTFVNGITKAIIACISLVIIAYIFTVVDLTGLGFEPKTIITSGIIVYTSKLLKNALELLGLTMNGKTVSSSTEDEIDNTLINDSDPIKVESTEDIGEALNNKVSNIIDDMGDVKDSNDESIFEDIDVDNKDNSVG